MCLAVLAVGVMQVFGVQVGYLCGCTGQTTNLMACQEDVCHSHGDHDENDHPATTVHEMDDEHHENAPCEDHHKHIEIRENLLGTTFRTVSLLPVVVFFDLPMAFHVPEINLLPPEIVSGVAASKPPEYGSPPMPQLVAETIVIRV